MKRLLAILISVLLAFLLLPAAGSVSYAEEVVFGDADGDGELTVQDASSVSRFVSGFSGMSAVDRSRADIDGDGKVTSYDSSLILSSFVSHEGQIGTVARCSFLVTSDLSGIAWTDPSLKRGSSCSALNAASCILEQKASDSSAILLDAGGSLFGSSIADEYVNHTNKRFGPITALFMKLQYDAVLLGDEAYAYPSNTVRREVNALLDAKIPVLGANLMRSEITEFDDENKPWNNLLPYVIKEVPQKDGTVFRVAIVGFVAPDLADWDDEVKPVDPLDRYNALYPTLKESSDFIVLLYHGNVESDESKPDAFSLRSFIRQSRGVDLVLSAHGSVRTDRNECDSEGKEVPMICLAGGPDVVTYVSVATRENAPTGFFVSYLDTTGYTPDQSMSDLIAPYVSAVSGIMDTIVCTNSERIDPYDPGMLGSSDCMDLIHEMQIWSAERWIRQNGADLPPTVISIAYPYLATEGIPAGVVLYRDLCGLTCEMPQYTLLIVRGSEIRAWLLSYKDRIMTDDPVYSLYGLSYLINTMNPETPLGFLEHSSGLSVEDDELFTLIIAEEPGMESILRPYLDETWMAYDDRVVSEFEMPRPVATETSSLYRGIDALTAYLENVGTLRLPHFYSWIVL